MSDEFMKPVQIKDMMPNFESERTLKKTDCNFKKLIVKNRTKY